VDTNTRHALKKDSFALATASSVNWFSGHRDSVVRWVVIAVVAVVAIVGGGITYNLRSSAADTALGSALDVYNAQLAVPGAPTESGVYASAADRSRSANQQFLQVANSYGWLPEGTKAHYFAGVTYADLGQTASAESELKIAAGSWNHNLANLAKLALAGLYHQTGRDSQAEETYNAIVAKPSETVPAAEAQLNLADQYASSGKQDQARALWAKIKDADKEGAAGAIASQKLADK